MSFIRNTVLERNRISKAHFERKPACLTGLVQRKKPVMSALDLIVYFEYSIIGSILICENVILI